MAESRPAWQHLACAGVCGSVVNKLIVITLVSSQRQCRDATKALTGCYCTVISQYWMLLYSYKSVVRFCSYKAHCSSMIGLFSDSYASC